jgi:glycine/D-amino acid oxidase-like deaminating enzyme/nitrite reductase/ring-hydroxylating ferredoxin subunit
MSKTNYPEDPQYTSGKHVSYWTDSMPVQPENPLKADIETDVVVVGAGMGGLSVAYNATLAGLKVVVLDDGLIGSGESGRTTGHLTAALDDRYSELEKVFGDEDTKLIAQSHLAAIDFIERVVKEEGIDCDFERVDGYLFLHPSDKPESLDKEMAAARKAGLTVHELKLTPGKLIAERCIVFPDQAQFHAVKYMVGLAKAIQKRGGKIYTGTHVSGVKEFGVETEKGFVVKAKHIVVATNSPINDLFMISMKQVSDRTYVIGATVKKGTLPHALWWDTGDQEMETHFAPYHYARIHPYNEEYDLIIAGGEDHPVGDTSNTKVPEDQRYVLLEDWVRNHFPIQKVIYRWSGQIMEPFDGLAYIGHSPMDKDNVYIVTGDSGNGLTHTTIAGMLITDLIQGKENPWKKIYRPSRLTLRKSGPVFKMAMSAVLGFLKRTPKSKDLSALESVKNGEAKVLPLLEEMYGVYRDQGGKLHIVSAVCTHMGCTVSWNADEMSWDCPCHGSRFTYKGEVMNGPAFKDLAAYSEGDLEEEEAFQRTKK